ncbi:MAG: 4-phosphoerythronate dehydrogenase [Kiritimatiellia bacterium]|nr:4-phosphoerythronate dehydrogenase [Kiritimatiellia bacterium]
MKIICTTSIPFAQEAFGPLGELQILDPRQITAAVVKEADILIARSTLKINAALLEGSKVKFAGTCTIGQDHVDTGYLEKSGIAWTAAPGCNANSVAEYVTTALLCLAKRHGFQLRDKTIGLIGVGNVGSLVLKKAKALGLRALLNDPPLFETTGDPAYRPLDEVLEKSDIITLHTPLTKTGSYPTFQLANRDFFSRLKPGCIFINSARGAILDSDVFLDARRTGIVAHAVIDCWEGEPAFRPEVMAAADIATPHIAGYSLEGRVMGTVHVYRKLCGFLGIEPELSLDALLPPSSVPEISFGAAGLSEEEALANIVGRIYDIAADDRRLREIASADSGARGKNFELLRKNYPPRREFRYTRVVLRDAAAALAECLSKLEFRVTVD